MPVNHLPRTIKALREAGSDAEKVEQWNSYSKTRKDFLDIIDLIAFGPNGIIGIQVTSYSNISGRLKKASQNPRLKAWLDSGGGFEVWGWKKQNGRYIPVVKTLEHYKPRS